MLEDSAQVMEKKGAPRQSNLTKPNSTFERKNDPSNTVRYNGRYNKRRDNGGGRGTPPEFSSRKPHPQKTRSVVDKRPRQRGSFGGRQREEIAETGLLETESFSQHELSKKGNLNYLLNFTFARREVVGSNQRRWVKRPGSSFSKECYLQANCQFVVKDSGDYAVQACDPDALVSWDLVEQVWTLGFGQTTCPICLQPPAAGKITKCGHVYCWACILHCLSEGNNSCRCPICFETVHGTDLRSVKVIEKQEHKVGDVITFQLMKRARDSTYAVPCVHWEDREGRPQHILDPINTEFAKVLVASAAEIQKLVVEEERQALLLHLKTAEDSEVCFIEAALVQLSERELILQGKTQAAQENATLLEQLSAGGGSENGNGERGDSGKYKGTNSKTAPSAPVVASPLPRNVSFDRSKIWKQYADAFEELEEEEEESVVSGEFSDHEDHEDSESTDSLLSMSSPTPEYSPSLPLLIPGATAAAASSEEEPLSVPSDNSFGLVPPEVTEGDTMTTEEAVEQLTMPAENENLPLPAESGNGAAASNSAPGRSGRNQSKRYFYFYQASDGQQIYLHSINARCICHEYGSLELGPQIITAKIVDKEITFMKEDIRKRVRYLSHVPKACEFQVVEVELQPPTVSHKTLRHFAGELRRRKQYRQKVKKEDRRIARKQNIEDKKNLYGIYPEVKLALDNPDHFPAPVAEGEERRRLSSVSDTASLSSLDSSRPELNVNAAEFVPSPKTDSSSSNTPCTFSFAAALKKVKQPIPSAWGASSTSTVTQATGAAGASGGPPLSRRADSEESDNEDRVPVPLFKNSFSDAISMKLDTLCDKKDGGEQGNSKGGKKKKNKEKKLLFSTDMRRR